MNDLDEIKEVLDLETWLENEGIEYKPTRGSSGPQLNVRECPMCGNSKYKVYLNAENGLGNCFACGEGYNKFKFMREYLGLGWAETFKAAKKAVEEQGWRPRRSATLPVEYKELKLPPTQPIPNIDGANLPYLDARGIDVDLAKYFHLSVCKIGLFHDRLIIPIFNLDSECVTFQGRDITGESDRKYLFPAELPSSGAFLFNGQNAVRCEKVVLGEGVFDVFAMKKAFDEESDFRSLTPIGSFGKHLSSQVAMRDSVGDQLGAFIELKRLGLKEVTIMWDAEPMALTAALDAAKKLAGISLLVRIALLPAGKDPNEVPPQVVREAYSGAKRYSTMLDVQWRLRNPYAAPKESLTADF